MQTISDSFHSSTSVAKTQAYSPSVPISVYRDLATELHSVQAKLDALTAQNQQLVQENQLLRQEIAKAVESVLRLQKLVDSQPKVTSQTASQAIFDDKSQTKQRVTPISPKEQVFRGRPSSPEPSPIPIFPSEMEILTSIPEPVFIEEQEVSHYPYSESESSQVKGWWLIIAISLIIVLGFGAGYLVVRPLLENHSR